MEKSTKAMTETQEKNHTDPIHLSSRTLLGQLMRRAVTRTKREQTEVTPLFPPKKKNSRYFWVPPHTQIGNGDDK